MAICNKQHRYLDNYKSLAVAQDDQKGNRHICAGCAYEAGLKDGLAKSPKKKDLKGLNLPYSQAGSVRHKNAYEAYEEGYEEGFRRSS